MTTDDPIDRPADLSTTRDVAATKVAPYSDQLEAFRATHPNSAALLATAEANRAQRLAQFAKGARLRGIEELLSRLKEYEAAYRSDRRLAPVSFLIQRSSAHFAVGLEGSLSGLHSVVHDAMRAVMEIEFLLRDFAYAPSHVEEWLTWSRNKRRKKFDPVHLRERYAARFGKQPKDMPEAVDYAAHSETLHASPRRHPLGGYGIADADADAWGPDICFWELYEHARRLLWAAFACAQAAAPEVAITSPDDLADFRDGWERTHQMQTLFLFLLEEAKKDPEAVRGALKALSAAAAELAREPKKT